MLLVRPREDGPKVIFANDLKLERPVDDEFRLLWHSIAVPADEELRGALERAGLKVASAGSSGAASPSPAPAARAKKATKRPFRRIKITNDYLEGIDLSVDPDKAGD